ncbi:MAG: hypothetical protein EXS13_02765 [Planctomycetes bacterium]|nr:hypothetical protein [Planctomycetota bacterium]
MVLPKINVNVVWDPRAPLDSNRDPVPIRGLAWWPASGGGQREILYWPYLVNGGAVMICMGADANGDPMADGDSEPELSGSRSLLVFNYYNHPSKFGSNPNRFDDFDGRREFSFGGLFGAPYPEGWCPGPAGGGQWLGPTEQAIEAGDIGVIARENYGMSIAASIARTHEAVLFVKDTWANNNVPGYDGTSFAIDGAYPHGSSFGQAMAMFLCVLQPQLYNGAVDWITSDLGFELGDYSELQG